tara:strand:+ start:958 stop:1539 length:582 start_codon:yes stop_codon:yes gene_type:complete
MLLTHTAFPSPSTIETHYTASRAALNSAEMGGKEAEEMVATQVRAARYQYEQNPKYCSVPYAEEIYEIAGGFTKRVYDGYIPELHLYIEVKSGKGKLTDSIDQKFYAMTDVFVRYGMGDIRRPEVTLTDWKAPRILVVLAGTKQFSGWGRLAEQLVHDVRTGDYPPDQKERASRIFFANIAQITPRFFDEFQD